MDKTLSVIIPILSNRKTLEDCLLSLRRLAPIEILIIVDENTNELKEIENLGCKLIIKDHHNNDSSRILGAKAAKGEVLLFLDGDIPIPSAKLAEFIQPIITGEADVVLNNLDKLLIETKPLSPYMVWCQILNEMWTYRDRNIDTLLSYPNAISRKVLNSIGVESLSNPLVSQMKIIEKGYKISRGNVTDSIPLDKIRPFHEIEQNEFNNYLEVLHEWLHKKGTRGGLTNGGKRLDIVEQLKKNKSYPSYNKGWGMTSSLYKGKQLSIVIPAQNEELTIGNVIKEARKIEPMEIIVVVNGSDDKTAEMASQLRATVIEYPDRLGHNVGRAIGALEASGDIVLFIDSDFAIPAWNLHPFVLAVANGVDIALNNLNGYLPIHFPLHNVSAFKYGLNLVCNREDLGVGALLAVPHAISKSCLNFVGFESLVCPSLAQMKAVMNGFTVSCVHSVDVIKPNRMRPEQHLGNYTDGGAREAIMKKTRNSPNFPYYQEKLNNKLPLTLGWGHPSNLYNGKQLSVIIPAQNHEKTIEKVIRDARKIEPLEIIVVVTGSGDDTEQIARKMGATVLAYKESLDFDTARAIGALASSGDIINFVNANEKGQTHAEMRIMGDHLEAIWYLLQQVNKNTPK
jgi:glycosyltransferase involved in cell wall biosynthesis